MSDYEHIKAVRYKPTEEEIDKIFEGLKEWRKQTDDYCWIKSRDDWYDYLEDVKFELLFNRNGRDRDYFSIGYGYSYEGDQTNHYVDFVLFRSYGDESGEWKRSRYLSDTEKEKWKIKFQKIFPNPDVDRLRLVDYCWYNGVEDPDVYDPEDIEDDFYNEV